MEETPHLVTHIMAVAAEKRLEDYHFLRNTYETITGQEIQLNRILRMLDEDEFSLNWRVALSPIGRSRSRSLFEFDRTNNTLVLQGSLAYERLRDLEQDNSKNTKIPTIPSTPRRVQELRERRQRLSEQRDYPSSSGLGDSGASSARLRALAEYDTGLAESQGKRQRQTEENRLNFSKSEEKDVTERRREKFKTTFDDENQKYERSKQSEDESSNRSTRNARLNQDQENDSNKIRKPSVDYDYDKPRKSLTKTTRFNDDQDEMAGKDRENGSDKIRKSSIDSKKRITNDTGLNEDQDNDSDKTRKSSIQSSKRLSTTGDLNEDQEDTSDKNRKRSLESNKGSTKSARSNEDEDANSVKDQEEDDSAKIRKPSIDSNKRLSKTADLNKDQKDDSDNTRKPSVDSSKRLSKDSRFGQDEDESTTKDEADDADKTRKSSLASSKGSIKSARFGQDEDESAVKDQKDDSDKNRKPSVSSSKLSSKDSRFGQDEDESAVKDQKDDSDKNRKSSVSSSKLSSKDSRFGQDEDESVIKDQKDDSDKNRKSSVSSSKRSSKDSRFGQDDDEGTIKDEAEDSDNTRKSSLASSKGSTKPARFNEDEDENENAVKDQEKDSDKNRKSSIKNDKSEDIELTSFTVRRQSISSTNKNKDEDNSLVRLLCQWASPSSSPTIDYFTIERQLGDNEWLPVGDKINKSKTQTQLDISPSNDDEDEANANVPSYFRLKAHLKNGQTFTSKPTDGILINIPKEKNVIIPDVKILSRSSVQLTWDDNENKDNENEEETNIYDIEKKEKEEPEWEKVVEVPLSQCSARIDSLTDAKQCEFRLIPSSSEPEETTKTENKAEPEVLTVHNVDELLNSLHIVPTSSNTVDIDISEEGFKKFDSYKIEYTTADQPDKWKQVSDITHDDPHLTIDKLKQGTDYKFRFTPILPGKTATNSSHLSLVLDVKTPSTRQGRFAKDESETPVSTPPQFTIQKLDPTSVLIEAIVPEDEQPAAFDDVYDVFSKKEKLDDDWTKVGTIDKDNLSTTVEDLEENTAYAFKIDNTTSPSDDNETNTVEEFKFDTTPVKQFDPSLFLEKIEQSLEHVLSGVMQAAAGHQVLEEPVNKSLNEVIKEVFRDETLVPNEQHGFDTLSLNSDLQLYRGPKQMMLKDLEIAETTKLSEHEGEIIIHNYPTSKQTVIVREDNGNTCVTNIDGDIIIRNIVSDVLLKNEKAHHQLSMNIVGQAFLKGVQGALIASKFKGIIVVKSVHKP